MTKVRRIGVVTGSRAEYGLLHRLLCEIEASDLLELQLIVTGTHFSDRHGRPRPPTIFDGHVISARVDMELKGASSTYHLGTPRSPSSAAYPSIPS